MKACDELFHTPDGAAYATFRAKDRRETIRVRTRPFKEWLERLFYEATEEAAPADAVRATVNLLSAKATFDGPERPVFVRVAEKAGAVYLDLANKRGEAVKITAEGWSTVRNPPVWFVRPPGMLPLPRPAHGGSVDELFDLVNLSRPDDRTMLLGCLLDGYRPGGGHPIVEFQGTQGTGKTTAMRMARALVDPNVAPTRGEPIEQRDLMIAANNAWVLGLRQPVTYPALVVRRVVSTLDRRRILDPQTLLRPRRSDHRCPATGHAHRYRSPEHPG